ncbi:hypothetical protein ACQZ4Q_07995 [Agrobacterium vitis]
MNLVLRKAMVVMAVVPVMMGAGTALADGKIVKVASFSHRENGCSESWKNYTISIPNFDQLDLDYNGKVGGIEVREVEANNGHRIGDTSINRDGVLSISLWAKGKGRRVHSLKGKGNVCIGGAGASEGVDIYAHYKP